MLGLLFVSVFFYFDETFLKGGMHLLCMNSTVSQLHYGDLAPLCYAANNQQNCYVMLLDLEGNNHHLQTYILESTEWCSQESWRKAFLKLTEGGQFTDM
jgi:hypothetical protein